MLQVQFFNLMEKKKVKVEIVPTAYEPKVVGKHVVYITDKKGKQIIPTYVIRSVDRPRFHIGKKFNTSFDTIGMSLYDPIVPSIPQAILGSIKKKETWNIKINVLSPTGDKIEEWEIKDAKLIEVNFGNLDWDGSKERCEIFIRVSFKNVTLNY